MFVAINIAVSLFFIFMVVLGIRFRLLRFMPLNLIGLAGAITAIWIDSQRVQNRYFVLSLMLLILLVLLADFLFTFNRSTQFKFLSGTKQSHFKYLVPDSNPEYFFLVSSKALMKSAFPREKKLKAVVQEVAADLWLEGNIAFLKGDFESACLKFNHSLEKAANSVTYLNLSGTYLQLNKNEEVIKNCNNALNLNKNFDEAWLNLSIALARLNYYEQALQCLEHANESKRLKYAIESFRGDIFYQNEHYTEALECFDTAIAENAQFAQAWYLKAKTLMQLDESGDALKCLSEVIRLNPEHEHAIYLMGIGFSKLHKYEEAIQCFEKVLKIVPESYEVWNENGIALCKNNRPKEAIRAFEKALEIQPNNAEVWLNQALALEIGEFYERAIFSYQKFLDLAPKSMSAQIQETQQRIRILHDTHIAQPRDNVLQSELIASVLKLRTPSPAGISS